MECLIEECHGLRGDLQRQEALVSQKEWVIAEMKDEAYTLWASGWLAFQRKAAKVFPGLDFNFQVPIERGAEKFYSDDEADPMVFSDAPSSVPLLSEPGSEPPVAANSPISVASDLHGLEVRVTEAAQSPDLDI